MEQAAEQVVSNGEKKSLSQQRQQDISAVASSSQTQPNQPSSNSNLVTDAKQPAVQLPSIDEDKPVHQQQYTSPAVPSRAPSSQPQPNKPRPDLLTVELLYFKGPRADYIKFGIPLYEASIMGDWKAARVILDQKPELIRFSLTENGETALHVATSSKRSKQPEDFVEILVELMEKSDLLLENNNNNTALYLAAVAGNIKTVKIMVEKNATLLTIPGAGRKVMPLYAAALFGNHEVVKYMYDKSYKLVADGWTSQNRVWLLEKCVENNMFDVALLIVKAHPDLASSGNILGVLARKPDTFSENETNCIVRTIKSVFAFIGSKIGASEKESEALILLKIIWGNISELSKAEIDNIIRGPPDPKQPDNQTFGKVAQVLQLQKLISEHIMKIQAETQNIMRGQPEAIEKKKIDQALQLQKLISEHIVNMHAEIQNIIERFPDSFKHDAQPTSGTEGQAQQLHKLISEHIMRLHIDTQKIVRGLSASGNENVALLLQKRISEYVTIMNAGTQKPVVTISKDTYSARILFVAAEMGNTRFVVELIRKYPDLIWKVNDNNQSIFHIAVKHRHEGIYNLLYEIGAMKDLITPLKDNRNDNNMLHLVAERAKNRRPEDVSGVALKMQHELLWFKEVEGMIPHSYRDQKNIDGLTPYELFTKEHRDLVSKDEEWVNGTANQCMVVAALIATIVFAAAFTIPGGYKQDDGMPMFKNKVNFMVFVVADAVSLFSSSASILMFLSILTSRYAQRDFLDSLPKKLILGLATLFLSITSMMVAFSVSFFVLYHHGLFWIPVLIGGFAVMPVLLYFRLQYALFFDVLRSTYVSRYLFKPQRHVLYYENPKV